jgi:glycosyltransferase involved in cell wall biosynthesis
MELLTNAMLFVLPSAVEGLSLALLDAMGAGRCVLVSDIPENREVVDGAGFTFRHGDSFDLEKMLRMLISNPQLREIAGGKARARVHQHYGWDQIARQIEDVYLTLLPEQKSLKAPHPFDLSQEPQSKAHRNAA